jgi:hypothetical protein
MLFLSGGEGYAWYVSFINAEGWRIHDERPTTRRELA